MGQNTSECKSNQDGVSRRRTLQGIGVGGASIIGGAGLTGMDLSVMGISLGSDDSTNPLKKYVPDVQVLHAKYEAKNGQFELDEHQSRGDVLDAIDSDDQLVDFNITKSDSNSGEILSFEADTSPYYMSNVVVTRNGHKVPKTADEAKDHFEFNGSEPVDCVYFFKKIYWQIDLLAGGKEALKKPPTYDWESDNLIKAAMANSVDGIVDKSPLTKNYDAVMGGALQEPDVYFEIALDSDLPLVAAYLPELPDYSDVDVEEPDLVHTDGSRKCINITLAVYERTGPEGEGRGESFKPELQKFIDAEAASVPFGVTPNKYNEWYLEIEAETGIEYL